MIDCISVSNMRESDRLTIERYVSGRTLMYRAAMGVYLAARWEGRITIAVGSGAIGSFSEAKKLIPVVKTYTPDPANKAVYDKQYAVFKNLYQANKKNFAALNG